MKEKVFEDKIFSIVLLLCAFVCFISFITNFYIDVSPWINFSLGLLGCSFVAFFYFSFFKGIIKPLVFPSQVMAAVGLSVNWFFFQGIEGAVPMFFFPAIFVLVYGNPSKRYWATLIGYIFVAMALVLINYFHPVWVIPYADHGSRLFDVSYSFIVALFMMGYATIVLKKNFDLERSKTEQRNRELEISESRLRESEASLKELNVTKDKFFSIVSHDLKNPFNAIIGFSNVLVEQVEEKNYEGTREYAGIIQHSAELAMNLLTNLLEWSRSQTGRMEFSPGPVEMVELINDVAELLGGLAQQKSVEIVMQLPLKSPVIADKAMISTILRNLVSNAIKFTSPGGRIVILASQKQDGLEVTVSDNGVGMKKETIEKLFLLEESHSTPGTQNEQGTGLGLILCKEFVEKHGGRIWAESELGKGSTFYFTIPGK